MANDQDYIRISGLIQKAIQGDLDQTGQAELDRWRQADPGNEQLYQQLFDRHYRETELQYFARYDEEAAYARFTGKLTHRRKRRLPWIAAASIILVSGAAAWFLLHRQAGPAEQQLVQQHDIAPGHNQATLTLASGKKIILTKGLNGLLATQGQTHINATANTIVYQAGAKEQPISYNTLSTARGEQSPYPLVLADGTKVWLNAESSITFPAAFNSRERIVKVTGEAYFEVVHDPAHPFKVQTPTQTIEDIGTAFDVNCYSDEPAPKTTLVQGSVKVNNLILQPGQQTDGRAITSARLSEVTAWKDGTFRFSDENIQTLMRQLARWYDIDVAYQGPVSKEGFNARISRSQPISVILNALQRTGSIHFKIAGRRVTVIE